VRVVDELTGRERAVLELMAERRSNQGIGTKLSLSPRRDAHPLDLHEARPAGDVGGSPPRIAVLAFLSR
jgi:hypothetical protein